MVDGLRAFWWMSILWIRSALIYRGSFLLLVGSQFVITGLDFVVIFIMFSHTPQLGGFDLAEVAFLYGASGVAMGLADLLVGNSERIGRKIRTGEFDAMMIRPVPVFIQSAADNFGIHRLGRVIQASVIFAWSIAALDVHWTWDRVLLTIVMVVCGTVIFSAIFVLGGAFQFAATDAAEVANAFTYGGNFLTQYPPTLFAREVVLLALFVIPLGFVNWMPALYILSHPDPLGLPTAFQFASPVAALLLSAVAALAWRTGVRNYRSTGS
ncbi:ABC transporter permease [Tenggerimyces flavus]|uniref:ABC transporter permease n=1 Tax=Tenggerimyces flavus TaxID=1708749 RepID=A0ABV7YG52_9ACTN|nr:ABC-2 family transporter protein [Tenggerimyces flavus]MBM7788100.1 ABC-2 type transport system permease protein [Tenggerimyces flavus]